MSNTLLSSSRWSTMSWMPCWPLICSAKAAYCSGSLSLTRNDSGQAVRADRLDEVGRVAPEHLELLERLLARLVRLALAPAGCASIAWLIAVRCASVTSSRRKIETSISP